MVYVVQERKSINILPAMKYGELKVLFKEGDQVGISADEYTDILIQKLSKFNNKDYLLLIGDPVLIGLSCGVITIISIGKFKVLKWDRMEKMYYPITIDIGDINDRK